jgi:beta-lactam-binding protein with PASTA domain
MRKLFMFVFIAAGLIFGGAGSFAATKQQTKQVAAAPTEIKGEVTKVTSKTLWVKDEAGKSHRVIVTDPKALEGIKVGDKVDVKLEKGKAASIQKVEGTMPSGNEMKMPEATPKAK